MKATDFTTHHPSAWLDRYRSPVETALAAACDFGVGCPNRLGEAMRYALLAPGKRLRPLLVLMAAEACVGKRDQKDAELDDQLVAAVMPAAVAVEMIHAYSLIHDDLPAMDDDDLRRGRPTVHIQFDEATAILAGDALLTESFRHLSTRVADPKQAIAAITTLAEAASAAKLVGGQADDLMAESDLKHDCVRNGTNEHTGQCDTDQRDTDQRFGSGELDQGSPKKTSRLGLLESIHRRKTAALIAASLDLGAILADADADSRAALGRYASALGLAFQVVDDNLDFTADTNTLGKRAGKDADRGKLTYPGLLGIEESKAKAERLIEQSKREAAFFAPAADRLVGLADYVLERTH